TMEELLSVAFSKHKAAIRTKPCIQFSCGVIIGDIDDTVLILRNRYPQGVSGVCDVVTSVVRDEHHARPVDAKKELHRVHFGHEQGIPVINVDVQPIIGKNFQENLATRYSRV